VGEDCPDRPRHLVGQRYDYHVRRSARPDLNDFRAIKRRTRPMLGFKDFRRARTLLSGIKLMHMIAKGR
jgi:transposase-like protein